MRFLHCNHCLSTTLFIQASTPGQKKSADNKIHQENCSTMYSTSLSILSFSWWCYFISSYSENCCYTMPSFNGRIGEVSVWCLQHHISLNIIMFYIGQLEKFLLGIFGAFLSRSLRLCWPEMPSSTEVSAFLARFQVSGLRRSKFQDTITTGWYHPIFLYDLCRALGLKGSHIAASLGLEISSVFHFYILIALVNFFPIFLS